MKAEERNFIYRFRYYLKENKNFFIKFLISVKWSSKAENTEALKLLK